MAKRRRPLELEEVLDVIEDWHNTLYTLRAEIDNLRSDKQEADRLQKEATQRVALRIEEARKQPDDKQIEAFRVSLEEAHVEISRLKKDRAKYAGELERHYIALNYLFERDPDKPTSWKYRRDVAEKKARAILLGEEHEDHDD